MNLWEIFNKDVINGPLPGGWKVSTRFRVNRKAALKQIWTVFAYVLLWKGWQIVTKYGHVSAYQTESYDRGNFQDLSCQISAVNFCFRNLWWFSLSIYVVAQKSLNTAFPLLDFVWQVTFAPSCMSVIQHDFMLNLFEDQLPRGYS